MFYLLHEKQVSEARRWSLLLRPTTEKQLHVRVTKKRLLLGLPNLTWLSLSHGNNPRQAAGKGKGAINEIRSLLVWKDYSPNLKLLLYTNYKRICSCKQRGSTATLFCSLLMRPSSILFPIAKRNQGQWWLLSLSLRGSVLEPNAHDTLFLR
jgi:hypothetical protein